VTLRSAMCLCASLSILTLSDAASVPAAGIASASSAQLTPDGQLSVPRNYREWVFLSSGLDMSYLKTSTTDHSMFDNVFVDPIAYRDFLRSGAWPEGTMLVKEDRGASQKGSINESGKFQTGELMGIEVHMKDSRHFGGGWAFFFFSSARSEPARAIPSSADCYSCHRQNGAVDTTFVQFYPTLLGIATQKRTLSRGYRP
jgi:hypothetical protein